MITRECNKYCMRAGNSCSKCMFYYEHAVDPIMKWVTLRGAKYDRKLNPWSISDVPRLESRAARNNVVT